MAKWTKPQEQENFKKREKPRKKPLPTFLWNGSLCF